ncbi:MAG: YqjF family protein [Myxococcota bacterium]
MSETVASGPTIGFQRWRDLSFLHWRLEAPLVRRHLPPGVDLDLFDGSAWVSVVPFAVEDGRPVGVPAGSGLDFLEANVRTYVRVDGEPGIWFFSLDASSRAAVAIARTAFGLPYRFATMRSIGSGRIHDYEVERRSGSFPRLRLRYEVGDALGPAAPGSLEHFLLERYALFTKHLGLLLRVRVRHEPYLPHDAFPVLKEEGLLAAAGLARPSDAPIAHYQPVLAVDFLPPTIVTAGERARRVRTAAA